MSDMGESYKPTKVAAFNSLRKLQLAVNRLDDPEDKMTRVREGVMALNSDMRPGCRYLITAEEALAKVPNRVGKFIYLARRVTLIGKLVAFGYMLDPDMPIDTMTLNFTEPEIWGINPTDAERLHSYQLCVPVLSLVTAESVEIDDTF